MIYIVYALHVVTCIFLIMVVLLQQGKGADLSVFGGGTTQAAFGARGAATLLHKLTVAFFILFMITTVSIGVLQRGRRASSVMSGVSTKTQPAPAGAPGAPAPPGPAAPSGPAEAAPEGAAPAPAPGEGSNGAGANSAAAPQSQAPAPPQSQAPAAPASGNPPAGGTQPSGAPPSSNP